MQIDQAEASHTERKCRSRRRDQATRRGHADLAGGSKTHRGNVDLASGSKAHGEEMQIYQAEADEAKRKCRFSGLMIMIMIRIVIIIVVMVISMVMIVFFMVMIWIRIRIKINSMIMIMIIIRRPSGEEGASAFRSCLPII